LDQRKNCGEYFTQSSLDDLKVKFQIDRLIDDNKILKLKIHFKFQINEKKKF